MNNPFCKGPLKHCQKMGGESIYTTVIVKTLGSFLSERMAKTNVRPKHCKVKSGIIYNNKNILVDPMKSKNCKTVL